MGGRVFLKGALREEVEAFGRTDLKKALSQAQRMELRLAMKENHCVSLRRAKQRGAELVHIQPRKPTQNAYIERLPLTANRGARPLRLHQPQRGPPHDDRLATRYNHHRPHRNLGGIPPTTST